MGTGYTRNDTDNNIADGNVINAADLDGEFDAIVTALSTSGHTHDGTAAEGGPVTVLGPAQDFVVSATLVTPKTTNTLDLGTSSLLFKHAFFDGDITTGGLIIDNAGSIGSVSDNNAITISSGGVVAVTATTASSSATTGAITIAGGAGVAADLSVGDDLRLISDSSVLSFGADSDVTLTHVADTGLLLNSTMALQFNDASQSINAPSATVLDINATDEIELNATLVDINANVEVSGTLTVAGAVDFGDAALSNVGAVQLDSIAGDGDTNTSITFSGSDVITVATGGTTSFTVDASQDVNLTNDLHLKHDAAVLNFGADNDVTLTHVADTGLLLNSTSVIQFNDASQKIGAPNATTLDIDATDEIELNATLVDINANLDVSGTYTGGGLMTTGGNIVIPDAGTIGSASDTDAVAIGADGDVTLTQDLELQHDGATIALGADDEITITHVADIGLTFTNTNTGDNKPIVLQLKSEEDALIADEVIASLEFAAGDSSTGDAQVVAAGIHAIAEGAFESNANPTKLVFTTGVSETAAASATAKMTLSSTGDLTIADDLLLASDSAVLNIGADNDLKITHDGTNGDFESAGHLTFDVVGDIILDSDAANWRFKDGGTSILEIGSVSSGPGFYSAVSDADMLFKGNDGGSAITALTLDMSAAGAATFNSSITYSGDLISSTAGASNFRAGVNAGISIASGGEKNVVVGDEAGTAITTGDNNVAIGFEALSTEDAHGDNVAIGYQALKTLNAGADGFNVAVGYQSGELMTDGRFNSLIGSQAGRAITSGDQNTALGNDALLSVTTASNNVAIGAAAGDALTVGANNTAVGTASLTSDTKGSLSTAIGYGTLAAQNFTTATDSKNTAVGYNAGTAVTTGEKNTLIGTTAGVSLTEADLNTAVGFDALAADTLGSRSVAIGKSTLNAQNFTTATNAYSTAVGYHAGLAITTGYQNTLIGALSGDALTVGIENVALGVSSLGAAVADARTTAIGYSALASQTNSTATNTYNVAVGYSAGTLITTGTQNTLVGGLSGDALTTGAGNVALGTSALGADTLGSLSTAIGYQALESQNFTTATDSYNTAVGINAGNKVTTGERNTIMGGLAGDALTDADRNTAIGFAALSSDTLGSKSTAVGSGTLFNQNFTTATDAFNTAVGFEAGIAVTTGRSNTLIGTLAGDALTDADYNVAIGTDALTADTLGSNSVAVGVGALYTQNFTTATDAYNVAVGRSAGLSVTTGTQNTLVGGLSGDAMTGANNNVAVGYNAAGATTIGAQNVAVGHGSLSTNTDGDKAVAIGFNALSTQDPATAGNTYNVAVGHSAGVAVTTAQYNTHVGGVAGDSTTTGNYNTFFGYSAGDTNVDGGQNVIIGGLSDTAATDGDFANGLGHDLSCVAGYTTLGKSTDDIRAAHGNVTWATVSDRRYKKDIVDSTAGLSFINALKPRTFKYKNLGELPETFRAYKADSTDVFKNSNTNHGFIAQEVKTAIDADSSIKDGFRLWDDRPDGSQEVAEAALIPMLTKAIQELSAKNDALAARIAVLEG